MYEIDDDAVNSANDDAGLVLVWVVLAGVALVAFTGGVIAGVVFG